MSNNSDILPPREGETDTERRLREAINRNASAALSALDAAIALRSAGAEVQRNRHLARGDLTSFAIRAMHAFSLRQQEQGSPHDQ